MPVILHRQLPVIEELQAEGLDIAYAPQKRGKHTVGILNLMPNHAETERHWLRLFAKLNVSVEIHFIRLSSWRPKTAEAKHLAKYYQPLTLETDFDGFLITGAPLGHKEYEQVPFWDELKEIFDMTSYYATSTLFSCWAANAALHHFYNIPRRQRGRKISGIYEHRIVRRHPLVEHMEPGVQFPHSRFAEARQTQLFAHPEVRVIMQAPNAGAFYAVDEPRRRAYIFGHPEYEADTLLKEFKREFDKGLEPLPPEYYFVDSETFELPLPQWQDNGAVLLQNWLNYWLK